MDHPALLYDQALGLYRQGELAAAEERMQAALDQAPDHAAALLLKGVVHPKSEAAIGLALVERSVRLDPFNAQAWYNLGVFEAER